MAERQQISIDVPVEKIDEDKRLVFGWASVTTDDQGNVLVDKQGDRISDLWELEKAAYSYVVNSRDGGVNHAKRGVAELVESMVFTPEKLQKMGLPADAVPAGWWVGYRVSDDDVWAGVKSGEYRMFSVHGTGTRKAVA
jgi:Putative phage serine protease XkdF